MPSRRETFGLAALEGMAHGKPVLHFDLPALRWMTGDVRVPPFDQQALACRMRELSDDEAGRRELGRQAYVTAERQAVDDMTDRHLALARELLGGQALAVAGTDGPPWS
jgi:glycosyltransferase involved in cell wall biosynthesis